MAPSNRKDHLDEDQLKDDLFGNVKMFSQVPAAYVSLKEAERENGVCLMDFKKFGVPLDGSSVMQGKRNGHMGIYLEPGYLQDVRCGASQEVPVPVCLTACPSQILE
eukprot:GFUD01109113.1.p1 GENE.GFUD01109113.1~~GFUD01109113.1.p1  ORF type:complete len:107 (+),score=33.75 GFUD01109113.1:52-372(+)